MILTKYAKPKNVRLPGAEKEQVEMPRFDRNADILPGKVLVSFASGAKVDVKILVSDRVKRSQIRLEEGFELIVPKGYAFKMLQSDLDYFRPWIEKTWFESLNHTVVDTKEIQQSDSKVELTEIPSALDHLLPNGKQVKIKVRVSTRLKKGRTSIDRDGSFTLEIPTGLSRRDFLFILKQALPWINQTGLHHSELLEKDMDLPEQIHLPLLGEAKKVLYFNDPSLSEIAYQKPLDTFPIVVNWPDGLKVSVLLQNDCISVFGKLEQNQICFQALSRWCRKVAEVLLPPYIMKLAQQEGFPLQSVAIRNQKSRWASCTSKQKINMNWLAIFLDLGHLEHLCWHELCHLRYMNHGREFHLELQRFSPKADEYEKSLDLAWRNLPQWIQQ